jgi:hypothetical protein
MNALEAAERVGACFEEDSIPYAVGGALALGVWGVPRSTKDVDVTAFVPVEQLSRVIDSLERAGVVVAREDAIRTVARIGLFKGRLGRILVDVFLSEHPQYADMQRRVRRVTDPVSGRVIAFLSPEDLMLHKLVFGRAKDVSDLEGLMAVRGDIDIRYVRDWLVQMVPEGDARRAILDDLERRFSRTT